jgi:hypothetical protein
MAKLIKVARPLTEEESQEQIRQINEVFPVSPNILQRNEIEHLLYIRRPDIQQDRMQIEMLMSLARTGKNVLLAIKKCLGPNAVERYNQGADIEVNFDDFLKWIGGLTREKQIIHFRFGFEGCKKIVQQHLQKSRISRNEYIRTKLKAEDFALYYSMVKVSNPHTSLLGHGQGRHLKRRSIR